MTTRNPVSGPYHRNSAVRTAFLIAQSPSKIEDLKGKNPPAYLLDDSRGLSATLRRTSNRVGKENWVSLVSINGTVPRSNINLGTLLSTDEILLLGIKHVDTLEAALQHDADVIEDWKRHHGNNGSPPGIARKPPISVGRKVNWAEKDFQNRELGSKGEQFILELERERLRAAGHNSLAEKVRWISEEEGDGLGYDVQSFEVDGTERFIEVKTTNCSVTTPFYVTQRELHCSRDKGEQYYLFRVHDFSSNRRHVVLRGPLKDHLDLESWVYCATIKDCDLDELSLK